MSCADAGFRHAEFLQNSLRLVRRQINQVAFNLRADDDGFAGEMRLDVVAHFLDERIFVGGGEVGFLHVAGENGRLVGEQEKSSGDRLFPRA